MTRPFENPKFPVNDAPCLWFHNAIAIGIWMRLDPSQDIDGREVDAYLGLQPYFREMPKLLVYETGVHFIDTYVPVSRRRDRRNLHLVAAIEPGHSGRRSST